MKVASVKSFRMTTNEYFGHDMMAENISMTFLNGAIDNDLRKKMTFP